MAALEFKLEGYEKEVRQLQKALEKSDKYIAELELQRDGSVGSSTSASNGLNGSGVAVQPFKHQAQPQEDDDVCRKIPQSSSCVSSLSSLAQLPADVTKHKHSSCSTVSQQQSGAACSSSSAHYSHKKVNISFNLFLN